VVAAAALQGHEANQKKLGSSNGIDTLLVCLAGFKSREPADAEEQEFVENLFDTLCSCLLLPANRCVCVWGGKAVLGVALCSNSAVCVQML
jgi:beta-catenin-like protein 1